MDFGEEKAHLSLQIPDKPVCLRELANALKFGHILAYKQSAIQIKLGSAVFSTLDLPYLENNFFGWGVLHDFVETLSVAFFKHRRDASVTMNLTDAQNCLSENSEMFAALSRPGLSITMSNETEIPISAPYPATLICPICITVQSYVYYAILEIATEYFAVEGKTVIFKDATPHIQADGT
jgi:hypothetical protein